MAYLHCHNCGWSQDDFWSEDYNPLNNDVIRWLGEALMRDTIESDEGPRVGVIEIDSRMFVSRALGRLRQKIRGMRWKTLEEWMKVKDTAVCPGCGNGDLDID